MSILSAHTLLIKAVEGHYLKLQERESMNDLLRIVVNGLTYAGNLLHSLINYSLIAMTIVPFLMPTAQSRALATRTWIGCLLIALAVQVILWFGLGAVGVSVIWSTMAGYSLAERASHSTQRDPTRRQLLTVALVSATFGILYYAVTLPLITTLAHGMAVMMGIGLFYVLNSLARQPPEEHDVTSH